MDNKQIIVVSQQGTGDFVTVQEAVDSVGIEPVVIQVEPGIYKEKIVIHKDLPAITFLGKDQKNTILTYDDNAHTLGDDGSPFGTFRSASLFIYAQDFMMENMTIVNSSGPGTGQAVAAFVDADRALFRKVRFLGDQDTLYTGPGRQYYDHCYIEGDVDFIFGPATAVFDHCHIHCKRKGGYITAASTPENVEHGYIFLDCVVTGGDGVENVYLGRPWRPYAKVVWVRTKMDASVHSSGWHNWGDLEKEKTSRYSEYGSYGPGANDMERVTWAQLISKEEASDLTPDFVLGGVDQWQPAKRSARV